MQSDWRSKERSKQTEAKPATNKIFAAAFTIVTFDGFGKPVLLRSSSTESKFL